MPSLRTFLFALLGASGLALGCGDAGLEAADVQDVTSGVAFEAEAEPLGDFSFDTGLIPEGSPAQVSLKLAAGGTVKVVAMGDPTGEGLTGKSGSGKVSLDLHVTMDGRLKIDSAFKKVDSDLPGLKDVDIPVLGEVTFDPFVLGDEETANAEASIPETKLPPIPLGSVPGKLEITVAKGSKVTSAFRGTCLSVADGQASYLGEATTGGTLVLRGQIALDLPAPLNKPIDLGEIEVPIPSSKQALDFGTKAAEGAADSEEGSACASPSGSSSGGSSSGGSSSGGSSSGGSSSGGSADGGTDVRDGGDGSADAAAPATKVSVKVDGQALTVSSTELWTSRGYDLFIRVSGPGVPSGSDVHVWASETGHYCSNTTNYIAYRPVGDTQYMPGTPSGFTCGLVIDALPTKVGGRFTGSFVGALGGINSGAGKTKRLEVRFDVLRDK